MKELPKTYNPAAHEEAMYAKWEKSGAFKPRSDADPGTKAEPYTIIMPPPNATGHLHTGHAIMLAIEDALIRQHRMRGFDTLYLPGTDHAAIATASVVEKQLAEVGKTRHDLGRTKFAKRAKDWADENRSYIENQFRAMGASADWSRNAFTMDPAREKAVNKAFRRLFEKGLIYRGDYMVNWDPASGTTLSDDEVEHDEREGVLYYIKYGPFTIATTRPETKVGDTAVAVHPDDKRYAKYVGQTIDVQTINGVRQLTVIADEMVDPEFGTGVVKITPFHDRNDYEVGKRHNLPAIEVIGEDGKMTAAAGKKLAGLDRFDARKVMVDWLKSEGLLEKEELIRHAVGVSYRSRAVIEPRISKQWFLNVSTPVNGQPALKETALKFVDDGKLQFVPKRFEKTFRDWIENLYDWCISRQVWFGHPVPVYLKGNEVSLEPKPGFKASEDTLDTWFSSALWAFSTLGWPDESESDFQRFYPTDVLETGYDIIPFWVSRMVLMTAALDVRNPKSGELDPPFHTTYLHGLVRDKRGRKFSKSLGNGVDPLELIGKYGTDALRFMLTTSSTPGNDLKFDEDRVVASRNFANKLWNISRFVLSQDLPKSTKLPAADKLTTFDRGILAALDHTIASVTANFEKYQLGAAGNELYDFIWTEFADWYLEAAKVQIRKGDAAATKAVLRHVLEVILKLLHPFMPFITETIWTEGLGHTDMLITADWPAPNEAPDDPHYAELKAVIETIRRLRAEKNVEPAAWINAHLVTEDPIWIVENGDVVNALARLKILKVSMDTPDTEDAVTAVVGSVTVVLPMSGLIDKAAERERLQGELDRATMNVERLDERLSNKSYVANAPETVVSQTRASLQSAEALRDQIAAQLEALGE